MVCVRVLCVKLRTIPLNIECNVSYISRFSSYCAVNTFFPHYENQSAYFIYWYTLTLLLCVIYWPYCSLRYIASVIDECVCVCVCVSGALVEWYWQETTQVLKYCGESPVSVPFHKRLRLVQPGIENLLSFGSHTKHK